MTEITITEAYLQASIFIGLAVQYLFMTWSTGKSSGRGAVLTYMAVSIILAFFSIYMSILLLPQFLGV